MKRVFIVHGFQATPDCNWFPWLKRELEKKGFEAIVPVMPDSAHPKCNEWVNHLKNIIGHPRKDDFFVGHSLGSIAILRYLEKLSINDHVGGAIFVSGFIDSLGVKEIESFFEKQIDNERIKKICPRFVVIHSDDDPYVSLRHGENLRDKLVAEFIIMHGGGHLNTNNGFFKIPVVLEKILFLATFGLKK